MDPSAIGAVLLAILGGVGGTLGSQLWTGVSALVRRPLSHNGAAGNTGPGALRAGDADLAALEQAPADRDRAVALAEVLLARANADAEFQRELKSWWNLAAPIRIGQGNVANVVSGGSQFGPVVQGRDFFGLTINAMPTMRPESDQVS